MGRTGITREDVIRAYVQLLKEGRYPGPTNLRLQLGTGSYTTIAQHLSSLALRHVRTFKRRHQPRARNSKLTGAGKTVACDGNQSVK